MSITDKPKLRMREHLFDSESERRRFYLECTRDAYRAFLGHTSADELDGCIHCDESAEDAYLVERAASAGFAMMQAAESHWKVARVAERLEDAKKEADK